jgi:hypothetical protein
METKYQFFRRSLVDTISLPLLILKLQEVKQSGLALEVYEFLQESINQDAAQGKPATWVAKWAMNKIAKMIK